MAWSPPFFSGPDAMLVGEHNGGVQHHVFIVVIGEVRTWESRRTQSGAKIRWFSTDQARAKLAKSYPTPWLKES
jgi:hypothetical protein